jgi:hypothetical protein
MAGKYRTFLLHLFIAECMTLGIFVISILSLYISIPVYVKHELIEASALLPDAM